LFYRMVFCVPARGVIHGWCGSAMAGRGCCEPGMTYPGEARAGFFYREVSAQEGGR